jgi:hypothetical protein
MFTLPPTMADFDQRGFRTVSAAAREVLEAAARSFLAGFNAELGVRAAHAPDLDGVHPDRRGFAVEGAAMAATMLDTPRRRAARTMAVRDRYGDRYVYLIHVGNGWAMAKMRRRRIGRIGADEPLLRWLAYDGMGFCHGFFAERLDRFRRHRDSCPATCDIRYQGIGRSLWFRGCADPEAVSRLVAGMPRRHHGDLWSGVGLAAAYAGAARPETYRDLRDVAGRHGTALAQGAAFAAEAWRLCGHLPEHARAAVPLLTGAPPEAAADWTRAARSDLTGDRLDAADYRTWRRRVQQAAAEMKV